MTSLPDLPQDPHRSHRADRFEVPLRTLRIAAIMAAIACSHLQLHPSIERPPARLSHQQQHLREKKLMKDDTDMKIFVQCTSFTTSALPSQGLLDVKSGASDAPSQDLAVGVAPWVPTLPSSCLHLPQCGSFKSCHPCHVIPVHASALGLLQFCCEPVFLADPLPVKSPGR